MTEEINEAMNEAKTEKIDDGCPQWAADDLIRLRLMEISLGNIPATAEWKSHHVGNVQEKVFSEGSAAYTDADIDRHFAKVVKKLQNEKFSAESIMTFVNNRVGYQGGPKYCSLAEVVEAFSKS